MTFTKMALLPLAICVLLSLLTNVRGKHYLIQTKDNNKADFLQDYNKNEDYNAGNTASAHTKESEYGTDYGSSDGKSVANATDKANKTEEEKEAEEGNDKVSPGYADDLAGPCIEDNDENNKYLKSVQPDVDKFFPMAKNGGMKVDTMNETDLDKYTEDLMKFSETFQKELKNRVIKDGKKCIKLNFKWEFMIDSMLNAELSKMDFLEETNETDVVEEKKATDGKENAEGAKDKEGEKEGEGKVGKEAEGGSAKKEEKEAKEEKGGEEKKEEGENEKKEEKKEKAARKRNRRV